MTYWLDLFTGKTWQEFLDGGGMVSGFRQGRWKTVQRLRIGDRLLCYMTGISRFVGVLEVTSEPFNDSSKIWSDDIFPCRVNVKVLIALSPDVSIPVISLKDQLSVFENLKSPAAWTGHFRGSPAKWKDQDGEVIYKSLLQAQSNPIRRPIDEKKLNYRPSLIKTKIGSVVIPETDSVDESSLVPTQRTSENTPHDKMQMCLAKLGSNMGLDVWVARNDRGRIVDGLKFSDLPRMLSVLPIHFDIATTRTIELIDVLWIKGKTIVAAFEIESTTSIYSGLLRMGDLISMQPNINIPLYIVAPDDRREKVMNEISRPIFSRLEPPMREVCSFISFSSLEQKIGQVSQFVSYLKPDFIDELAEVFGDNESEDSESLD